MVAFYVDNTFVLLHTPERCAKFRFYWSSKSFAAPIFFNIRFPIEGLSTRIFFTRQSNCHNKCFYQSSCTNANPLKCRSHIYTEPKLGNHSMNGARPSAGTFLTELLLQTCFHSSCTGSPWHIYRQMTSKMAIEIMWNLVEVLSNHQSGLIVGLHPANERRRYFVTTSLIGWGKPRISPDQLDPAAFTGFRWTLSRKQQLRFVWKLHFKIVETHYRGLTRTMNQLIVT